MAAGDDPKDITASDKAYQAAVEASPVKAGAASDKVVPTKVEKAGEQRKVSKVDVPTADTALSAKASDLREVVDAPAASAKPEQGPEQGVKERKPAKALSKPGHVVGAAAAAKARPSKAERIVPVKAATPKPAVKVAGASDRLKTPVTRPAAATPRAAKTAPISTFAELFTHFMLEDKTMDMSGNFSGFQSAITEAQAKAKDVFEKSTKMFGEVGDFTKGNVEAVMESGKILAEGVQSLGSEIVAEGRTAFEAMSGDIKELAAAKSPTDFFKIQSDMMRKNFDSAVAYGSKNSEAMLKLVSDVMAPISGRVSLAVEKARSASL